MPGATSSSRLPPAGGIESSSERAALLGSSVKFFYCGRAWFKMTTHEQAWKFVRVWPQVVEFAEHHKGKMFEIEGANLKVTPCG